MAKKKFLGILVALGMISLNTQPFFVLAQTATPESGVAVFSEDFNGEANFGVPSGWSKTGDWGVAYVGEPFNEALYGDVLNIPYEPQPGSRVVTPSINLSGASNAEISFLTRCETEYSPNTDYMKLQVSNDGSSFTDLMSWNEETIDNDNVQNGRVVKTLKAEIPSEFLTEDARIAFMWIANSTDNNNYDGCFVDDIVVVKDATGESDEDESPEDTEDTDEDTDENTGEGDDTDTDTDTGNDTGTDNDDGTTDENNNPDDTSENVDEGTDTGTGENTDDENETGENDNANNEGEDDADEENGSDNDENTDQMFRDIEACGDLTESGVTYRFSKNLHTSSGCFNVTADNIIIDGNGFEVIGNNASGVYGVKGEQQSDLTVKNITFRDFDYGVWLVDVNNVTVDNVQFDHNMYGLVVHGAQDSEIKNTIATNNQNAGLYVKDLTNSTVRNNSSSNNSVGLHIESSTSNIVTGNTINNNDRGILLIDSHENVIDSNGVTDNMFGIAVENGSSGNTFSNMTLKSNDEGIALAGGDNTVEDVTIEGSKNKAIRFFEGQSVNNSIENVHIVNTQSGGFDVSFDEAGPNFAEAAVDGTMFVNTPVDRYFIAQPGGTLGYANSFGSVVFTQPVWGTGSNLSDDIKIEDGKITISEMFDVPATLSFATSSTLMNTSVTKDGVMCATCTSGENELTFSVTGAGTYELMGTVSTTTTGTTTDDTNDTDENDDENTDEDTDTEADTDENTDTDTDTNTDDDSNDTDTDETDNNDTDDNDDSDNDDKDEDTNENTSSTGSTFIDRGGSQTSSVLNTTDDGLISAEVAAIIAILESESPVDTGPGTTLVSTDGAVDTDTSSAFTGTGGLVALGVDENSTVEVGDTATGTGGPVDLVEFEDPNTAAITDTFSDENPNQMLNLIIGALILIVVIAIIAGMSRRA